MIRDSKDDVLAIITRRSLLLGGIGLLGVSLLASRLYYLQFIHAEKYRTLAEGNRIKLQVIAPERGLILDRTGQPLAENRDIFRLFIDREGNSNPAKSLANLRRWITISDRRYNSILAKLRHSARKPILIRDELSWQEVVAVEYHIPDMPGIFIERGKRRFYPLKHEAAHILGYVGGVSEQEQKLADNFYRWPEAKIGKQGLEKQYEKQLRGIPGFRHIEVDARGLAVKKIDEQPSIAGDKIISCLHGELQRYSYELLMENVSGAAVVINIHNGEVLSLASAPAFDSNIMSSGISKAQWQELQNSERLPLLNKATIGQYPPGSTFKMITALAGLQTAVTNAQRYINCPGYFYLGRQRFRCWKRGGHGWVNLQHAIAESCDTYFYTIANEMGIQPIAAMAMRFGLGKKTDIDLPIEKSGLIPTEQWKRRAYGQIWHPGDTINASIGQGYVLTTPLQLAVMTAQIANGGHKITPHLTLSEEQQKSHNSSAVSLGIAPQHLQLIYEAMTAAVNKPYGTAYGKHVREVGKQFAGKTGTAQVRKITIQGEKQHNIPWNRRHHALFVGYAPIHKPQYAVSVVIEHGGGGSKAAAPVARDLLRKTMELFA